MKKNGFSFIETIVTVVVLSTSLLYLYSSYSNIILNEERRLTYDDPAYIYKTSYIKKFIETNTDLERIKTIDFASKDSYVLTINPNYENLSSNPLTSDGLEAIINSYHIYKIVLIDSQIFENCNFTESENASNIKCRNSKENISTNMQNYLKSLNSDNNDYYIVIEYTEKLDADGKITKCVPIENTTVNNRNETIYKNCDFTYYSSLGI